LVVDVLQALQAAQHTPVTAKPLRVVVFGGGGPLGSAVLEALLAQAGGAVVGVAVGQPMTPALRGLHAVMHDAHGLANFAPHAALLVFDRKRHANGRDEAFVSPQPVDLLPWAQQLYAAGVRQLVVAVPHTAALLPQALLHGLANLDEGAVAALGFEQLVFMRMARAGRALAAGSAPAPSWPQRVADWMLLQMRLMVPVSEQPVRVAVVADVLASLVYLLPRAAPATRVLPPVVLWHAAQGARVTALLADWLDGKPLPARSTPVRRM
jgi:hypothetical protein